MYSELFRSCGKAHGFTAWKMKGHNALLKNIIKPITTNFANVVRIACRQAFFTAAIQESDKRGERKIPTVYHQLSPGLRACEGSYGIVGNVQAPATLQQLSPYNSLSLFLSLYSRSEAKWGLWSCNLAFSYCFFCHPPIRRNKMKWFGGGDYKIWKI